MKQRFKQLLLTVLVALVSCMSASAYDFEVDGIYYNVISTSDLTCKVTSGDTKYSGSVTIPSTVEFKNRTFTVTTIESSAFKDCSSLTSVEIPNSVTTIGWYAFLGCSSLTSVEMPNSVTTIGGGAFSGCSSMTSVEIPNSVTEIGSYAFNECSSLTLVEIPNSVTVIGEGAFADCRMNENFTGKFASDDHRCLIVDGVLNSFAPAGLSSYEIPNSVTEIGRYAFWNCSSLTSVVIPSSVTMIGSSAFKDCSSLTSLEIPNSVTEIGMYAFMGCSSLTSVVIPNSVTKIVSSAFYDCSNLTSVVIPNSVTEIGSSAFAYCPVTQYVCDNGKCLSLFKGSKTLKEVVIGNSVTWIGESAFSGCSSLTSVEIGNSVTEIGRYAFWNCSSLTSVEIPKSVTTIGENTFYNCPVTKYVCDNEKYLTLFNSTIQELILGTNISALKLNTYAKCSGLTEIVSLNTTPPTAYSTTFSNVTKLNATVKVPAESLSAYQSAKGWKEIWEIVALTDEEMIALGVDDVEAKALSGKAYNLSGQPVLDSYKGIFIKDGKKYLKK